MTKELRAIGYTRVSTEEQASGKGKLNSLGNGKQKSLCFGKQESLFQINSCKIKKLYRSGNDKEKNVQAN